MKSFDMIALSDAQTGSIWAEQKSIAGQKVQIVQAFGLAALLVPATARPGVLKTLVPGSRRRTLIKRLGAVQKLLEALIGFGPLLVVGGDRRVESPQDALHVLAAHQGLIKESLAGFGSKLQFQITVRWDPAATMTANRSQIENMGASGPSLASFMEDLAAQKRAVFTEKLASAASDVCLLPVDDAQTLVNAAVLVERTGEQALDNCVEAIDQSMPDQLHIHYRGPLPAMSFAMLELDRPGSTALCEARAVLGVESTSTAKTLRSQYLNLVRANHPDAQGDGAQAGYVDDDHADQIRQIKDAYHLLNEVALVSAKHGEAPVLATLTSDKDRKAA